MTWGRSSRTTAASGEARTNLDDLGPAIGAVVVVASLVFVAVDAAGSRTLGLKRD